MEATQTRQSGENPALHGLRGFAFLLVLLAHFSNHYGGPFQGLGKVGVWLFFALSAYLLAQKMFADGWEAFRPWTLANYSFRRFMRIVPLYALTLVLYLPFGYVVTHENLFAHVTFQKAEGHLWTVVVELQFYFLLPLIALATIWLSQTFGRLAFVFPVALWVAAQMLFDGRKYDVSTTSVLPYLCIFLSGVIVACAGPRRSSTSFKRFSTVLLLASLATIVLTTPSVWSLIVGPVEVSEFYRSFGMFSLVSGALVFAAATGGSLSSLLFSTPALQLLGKVSFSGYLIHPLMLRLTSGAAEQIGTPAAVVLSIAAIAAATLPLYFFIERPLQKLSLKPPLSPQRQGISAH